MRSALPGRMLCTKTSARVTRRWSAARPASVFRSNASERLPALAAKNITLDPSWNSGPQARASSPRPGCSTLTTSAPSAARICVHHGPASDDVTSTIRIPANGRKDNSGSMVETLYHFLTESPQAYLLVFGVAAGDAIFPALPSETLLILGGVLASHGELDLTLLIV